LKTLLKSIVIFSILTAAYFVFIPAGSCGKAYIPKGTEIAISYKINLSTELKEKPTATEIFEIAANQTISGIEVIQQGGKVFCEITDFKKPGLLGGAGFIEVRIDSVRTALGRNITVEAKILNSQGSSKRLKALLMLPILGYGLLVKGEHAELGKQNETVILKTSELNSISF